MTDRPVRDTHEAVRESVPALAPRPLPTVARWVAIGTALWVVLAVLYILGMGLRLVADGRPFIPSGRYVADVFVMFMAGGLLTPLLLLAFRRGPAAARRRGRKVVWYVGIGVAYWLAWALLLIGFSEIGVLRSGRPGLAGSIILMAYISLAAYTVLVMLYETMRSFTRARAKEREAARLQAELSLARADALRARLDPDSLLDTFEAASQLMETDPRAARRVLADVGTLLRTSLGRNGSDQTHPMGRDAAADGCDAVADGP